MSEICHIAKFIKKILSDLLHTVYLENINKQLKYDSIEICNL